MVGETRQREKLRSLLWLYVVIKQTLLSIFFSFPSPLFSHPLLQVSPSSRTEMSAASQFAQLMWKCLAV